MERHLTRRTLGALALSAGAASIARAESLAPPGGKPILTVSGRIGAFNKADTAEFDRDMLEALGTHTVVTTTPWHSGPVRFEGVRMDRLMQAVEATGDSVTAVALNDYTTEIPISDFRAYGTTLALKRDGAYMPVRDKGPLFIIYPYDSNPELKRQVYFNRSAWQVARLIVK